MNYKKGFTLLEILVVLLFTSILSSIAVSKYLGTINDKQNSMQTDLAGVRAVFDELYVDDGEFPMLPKTITNWGDGYFNNYRGERTKYLYKVHNGNVITIDKTDCGDYYGIKFKVENEYIKDPLVYVDCNYVVPVEEEVIETPVEPVAIADYTPTELLELQFEEYQLVRGRILEKYAKTILTADTTTTLERYANGHYYIYKDNGTTYTTNLPFRTSSTLDNTTSSDIKFRQLFYVGNDTRGLLTRLDTNIITGLGTSNASLPSGEYLKLLPNTKIVLSSRECADTKYRYNLTISNTLTSEKLYFDSCIDTYPRIY